MKKKSRIQIASQIIAQLKREMQEPRFTDSIRNGESLRSGLGKKGPAVLLREPDTWIPCPADPIVPTY